MVSFRQSSPDVNPEERRGLSRELEAAGYQPDTPPHITEATRQLDSRLCRFARCEQCDRRGLVYRPYRRGRAYRIVAVCTACHHEQER